MDTLLLEGPHHQKPGTLFVETPMKGVCWGTSAGSKRTVKTKMDGNEDYASLLPLKQGLVFCLCDSHFGKRAGELCAKGLPPCAEAIVDNPIHTMFERHYELDRAMKNETLESNSPLPSGTTMISGYLEHNCLSWVSSGDSSLFLFRRGTLALLNERRPNLFIGTYPATESIFLETFQLPSDFYEHPGRQVYAHLVLSHICTLANNGTLTESLVKTMLDKLREHTGIICVVPPVQLTRSWNEANTRTYKNVPEWGQLPMEPQDLIIGVSDGICDPDDPETRNRLEVFLNSSFHTPCEMGECILKDCLKSGGRDNATCLIIEHPMDLHSTG
jgi:serine/threonine protein phosphatase PrpC